MRTVVTARHCEIPNELKARAVSALEKVARAAHRPQRAQVVFDADHGRKVVELQLHLPRGQLKVATAEANDFQSALDGAIAKMRNQLDKAALRPTRRAPTR